jgi:ElaB/YqjD/DUF883 family membrane-anchored ribosome-binding protein
MTSPNGLPASTLNDRIHSLMSNFKNVTEHLSSAASSFKDRASEAKSHAAASASSLAAKTGKVIKAHPIMAIGVAVGAGYLVMRLLRR